MANALNSLPMILDTDITTWRNSTVVSSAGYKTGIRVSKLVLAVGPSGASSAGSVTITAPSDSSTLYPPIPIAASVAANSILVTDEPTEAWGTLTWRDFAVTGLTATGTRLFLWWTQ
jgi:hypothetical protein